MACDNFGLTISTKKTEVVYQPAPGKPYVEPNITIKRQLKVVQKFTSFGGTVSKSIVMDDEVNTRLAKVITDFGWLNRNMSNRRGISEVTKMKIYRAVVLTTLSYGCESWTTYQRHIKKLNHFHTTCLRKIHGMTWQKHIQDTEVLIRAFLPILPQFVGPIMLFAWKITTFRRKCSTAVSEHALPRRSVKTFQRHTEGLHEIFPYHPKLPEISGAEQRRVTWSCQTWSESLWNQKKRSNWAAQET